MLSYLSTPRIMKKSTPFISLLLLLGVIATPSAAQQNRPSPTATVEASVNGQTVKIVYARPQTKHPRTGEMREIWGALVPYGQVWRTGANEATLITTSAPLMANGKTIPAGTYSLYSVPTATGGELIINKQTGQWGTVYNADQDLVRVPMTRQGASGEPVHQFTIELKAADGGIALNLIWEDAVYTTAFTLGS